MSEDEAAKPARLGPGRRGRHGAARVRLRPRGARLEPAPDARDRERRDHAACAPADAGARLQPQPQAPEGVHRGRPQVRRPAAARRQGPGARPRLRDHRARRDEAAARADAGVGAEGEDRATSSTTPGWRSRSPTTRSRRPPVPIVLDEAAGAGAHVGCSRRRCRPTGWRSRSASSALLLAGGALAAERDENVIGRLVARPRRPGPAGRRRRSRSRSRSRSGSGLAIAGRLRGRGRDRRRPRRRAVAADAAACRSGSLLAGAAVGALGALVGALARESRTASLVGSPRRPARRLPRARPEGDRPGRRVDQRRCSRSATRCGSSHRRSYDGSPWGTIAVEAVLAASAWRRCSVRWPGSPRDVCVLGHYASGVSTFPVTRLRRLRRTDALRSLVRETRLDLEDFVMPLFVGPETEPNEALPAMGRWSVDGRRRGDRTPRRRGRPRRDPVRDPGREGRRGLGRLGRRRRDPAGAALARGRGSPSSSCSPTSASASTPSTATAVSFATARSTTTPPSTCSPARPSATSRRAPTPCVRAT